MAQSFYPPDLWPPFGPFTHAAISGDAKVVYLKGHVAL